MENILLNLSPKSFFACHIFKKYEGPVFQLVKSRFGKNQISGNTQGVEGGWILGPSSQAKEKLRIVVLIRLYVG